MSAAALRPLRRLLARLIAEVRAIGAVEFAITAPVLILLYLGGYQLMDAISAYRKVTVTARTLADLTSQNESITYAEATSIINGARQVMTPYSTEDSTLILAEIRVDGDGAPHLVWKWPSDADVSVDDVDLPEPLKVPNTHVVFSQIVFHYTPVVGGSLLGSMTLSDHIFMNPRRSDSVCLNSGTVGAPVCVDEGQSS